MTKEEFNKLTVADVVKTPAFKAQVNKIISAYRREKSEVIGLPKRTAFDRLIDLTNGGLDFEVEYIKVLEHKSKLPAALREAVKLVGNTALSTIINHLKKQVQ